MFHGQGQHLAAQYSMSRRFETISHSGFVEIDFRSAGWFGSTPRMSAAERAMAMARGVVKRVSISVDTGTVKLAEEASPVDRYSISSTSFPVLERKFHTQHRIHGCWIQAEGPATFEIEVEFDVLDLGQ